MAISEHLKAKLELLPDQPGCYIMKNDKQEILYVGKAKVLKNRVRSYFHGVHNNKTTKLVSQIADFEFIVTDSEKEALLLEINLIKKHRPPFNIMFMDDKMYPYIEVTNEPNFTVRISRKVTNKKNQYFGPYPLSSYAYEIVKLIHQIYPIRKCKNMSEHVCLYYHMHQCLAPCEKKCTQEQMEELRRQVIDFLRGDSAGIKEKLQVRLDAAVESLQFERAQEIHETMLSLDHIMEKQKIDLSDRKNRDIFGWYEDKGYVSFQGLIMREGKMLERTFSITPIYEDIADAFTAFVLQYYQKNIVPSEIYVPAGAQIELLETALNTKVKTPQKGQKKELLDLAMKNAREAHEQKFNLVYKKNKETEMAMLHLSRLLHTQIHTVELFDNSHIQGSYNVSALVVFADGQPAKNLYRKYKLSEYRSDTDSMKEVIERRYSRLKKEGKPMPDLLLVDGGIAQIHAAKEVLEKLDLHIPLAGLVKDDKHSTRALLNENLEELPLEKTDALFFLLTRMQDEVHRFAIEYHRSLRSKGMTRSLLDDVKGIGPARKKELQKRYKSMKQMKEATPEQLQEVLPEQVAKELYRRLHEN
jgi:excinuclease ABC subunit C